MTPLAELLIPPPGAGRGSADASPLAVIRLAASAAGADRELAQDRQVLPAAQTAALCDRAKAHDVPLSIAILGAWAMVLRAYCGAPRVEFGLAAASGDVLLCRIEVTDGLDAWDWMAALHEQVTQQARLVSERPGTAASTSAAAPHAADTILGIAGDLAGIALDPGSAQSRPPGDAGAPGGGVLSMGCWPGERLILRARYDWRYFTPGDVGLVIGQFRAALAALAACANQPPSSLRLFADRDRWLAGRDRPPGSYPVQQTTCSLFQAQAVATPDAVACAVGDREITYAQLSSRVLDLAQRIKELQQ